MNTDDLTIAEAEALYAEPLDRRPDKLFCEPELIAVYRRVTAEMLAVLENYVKIADRADDRECSAAVLQSARAALKAVGAKS